MKFSIIAAADLNNGIGIKNRLPWRLSKDLEYFSMLTRGNGNNAIIMGHNTWRSLPKSARPLDGRLNIVLGKNFNIDLPQGVLSVASFNEAFKIAENRGVTKIFVIGGASVYAQAIKLPECSEIFLTRILHEFKCDTFFPIIDPLRFKKISESEVHEENGIKFKFVRYMTQSNPS